MPSILSMSTTSSTSVSSGSGSDSEHDPSTSPSPPSSASATPEVSAGLLLDQHSRHRPRKEIAYAGFVKAIKAESAARGVTLDDVWADNAPWRQAGELLSPEVWGAIEIYPQVRTHAEAKTTDRRVMSAQRSSCACSLLVC